MSALTLHVLVAALCFLLALAVAWIAGPSILGRALNRVAPASSASSPLSSGARELHGSLDVVDLHADALLWGRDLLVRGWGHVDVPRLIEGRVAVQAFTAVTKVPRGNNIETNRGNTDLITWLARLQRWPPAARRSLLQRALFQARRFRETAARSAGALTLLETRSDLEEHLERRRAGRAVTAGFLGLEGAHALEADPHSLDLLFDAGFRLVGLAHFTDNEVGGSAHGLDRGGLTELGARVVERMERLGMVVDLAHASPALIDDVLAVATRPVLVSHTGLCATCDNRRNLDDARARAVAEVGGLLGIGLWETAICGTAPSDWARAVRRAIDIGGVEHVALGSDWDGAVRAIVDAAGTGRLTGALLEAGLDEEAVRAVMGGNAIRFLLGALPESVGPRGPF